MTSRIGPAFRARRAPTGLIPYLTAGYPSLEATVEMATGLADAGALALEIGIPFSDPIADGPEIQRSSEWALARGVGYAQVFGAVRELRRRCDLPVVVMTYANPVVRAGAAAFARAARESGVDGLIVSDLPPEESPEVWSALDAEGLDTVMLVAPTTPGARVPLLLGRCRGFVYCLARTGVTGRAAGGWSGSIEDRVAALRARTALPVAVGFGISNAQQAAALRGVADAVIVGAAFMRAVSDDPQRDSTGRVLSLARELALALGAPGGPAAGPDASGQSA
jgi:tryptophan synthase alpha chain